MSRRKQRAVIRYLTLKNLSVAEITTELQSVYGTDALKYSTVSKRRLRSQDGSDDPIDLARSRRPSHSDLAAPIQSLLQQFPFISCKALCRKLKIDKATCLRVLHDDLHLEKFNLRSVLHSVEADQRRSRVELSRELLQILEQDQQYQFEHILTGDEIRFFLNIFIIRAGPQIQMRCLKFRSKTCNSKSASFRLFGVTGIKSLLHVPKGMKYNTTFFVESIVRDLVEHVCQESRSKTLRGIMVHLDNARPHNSRKVGQLLLQQKPVESLLQFTVQIHLRVTSSSLECSRNECPEQNTALQMKGFLP
jgi:hypothetical protein